MINLAQRDIAHSLGKFLTTATGVGMLLGVVLIMIGVYRGLVDDASILLKDTRADLWIVQQDTLGPFAESSRIHEDIKHQIKLFKVFFVVINYFLLLLFTQTWFFKICKKILVLCNC